MKLDSIQKTLPLLLLMTMGNWACSDNDPVEEVETETVPELSIEAEVYSTLLSNYYQTVIDENKLSDSTSVENLPAKFVPSMGIVLDESRPSVRSAEAETYDEAHNDFMSLLPDEAEAQKLISVSDKKVSVNLGDYGSVTFSASNEDGSLAKAEMSLANVRPYTLYYKPHAAFPDNQGQQNLSKIYSPGTILYKETVIKFPFFSLKLKEYILVIEASSFACYGISSLSSTREEKDHWKDVTFYHSASEYEWQSIRRSWTYNRDAFIAAYEKHPGIFPVSNLYDIMEGSPDYPYICIDGDDIGAHTVLWWARHTWFSWTKRVKIKDFRTGNYSVEKVRYADGTHVRNTDSYHLIYKTLSREDVENYEIVYPVQ